MAKLDSLAKGTRTTVRISSENKTKEVPKGAEILSKEETIRTEKIENGWLLIKEQDITYRVKGKEYSDYTSIVKKWYTEEDPLEVKLNDKGLAEDFDA